METDITQTTTTEGGITSYEVGTAETDGVQDQKESTYMNQNWTKQLGGFKGVPQYNRAVSALAFWSVGGGYTSNQKGILDNISGRGDSDFISIMKNMLKTKNFGEDAYAHAVRNEAGALINLKPLNTGSMRIVYGPDGVVIRYEQVSRVKGNKPKKFKPTEILHLSHDPIADELHGTSTYDLVEWVVTAKQEAMEDWKRISHRSTIRVLYVDEDKPTRLANLKRDYKDGIKKGELLILPCKKGEAAFEDLQLPPVEAFLAWMRYLDNFFYQVVGIPKVIADATDFTEAGGKMGFLTFEPVYVNEQKQLEADLWNQLAIKVKFNRPPSLSGELKQDEAKDGPLQASQTNDVVAGRGE